MACVVTLARRPTIWRMEAGHTARVPTARWLAAARGVQGADLSASRRALARPHGCGLSAGEKMQGRSHPSPLSRPPSLGELLGTRQAERQVWRKHTLRIVHDPLPPLKSAERQAERRAGAYTAPMQLARFLSRRLG